LERESERIALVAITGASNVSGYINPIHRLAEKTHAVGAQIAVDCAQLAPHRKINIRPISDPTHLDYIFLSAHKMYAPFGTGALIGRRDTFSDGVPDLQGGGEVEIVTLDHVEWSPPPDRDEAGSQNIVGAVALAAAITQLEAIGMDAVADHEKTITRYALMKLKEIPGVQIYGSDDLNGANDRLGVIPFNFNGLSHYLVAAILGYEFGIGVRNGCFCAHPYMLSLLKVDEGQAQQVRSAILAGDRSQTHGMVRCSIALYNDSSDVDVLFNALQHIAAGKFKGNYSQDISSGQFLPAGWIVDYSDYFRFTDGSYEAKKATAKLP
jgi:cysteine desulfurase/selenocysteine lyase